MCEGGGGDGGDGQMAEHHQLAKWPLTSLIILMSQQVRAGGVSSRQACGVQATCTPPFSEPHVDLEDMERCFWPEAGSHHGR